MGKSTRIHLLDPAAKPESYFTVCGITLRASNTTSNLSIATCKNCLNLYHGQENRSKPVPHIPPPGNHHETYGFHQEKKYLNNLGTGTWSRTTLSRKALLEGYINTINLRSERWVPRAKQYAEELLEKEICDRA